MDKKLKSTMLNKHTILDNSSDDILCDSHPEGKHNNNLEVGLFLEPHVKKTSACTTVTPSLTPLDINALCPVEKQIKTFSLPILLFKFINYNMNQFLALAVLIVWATFDLLCISFSSRIIWNVAKVMLNVLSDIVFHVIMGFVTIMVTIIVNVEQYRKRSGIPLDLKESEMTLLEGESDIESVSNVSSSDIDKTAQRIPAE